MKRLLLPLLLLVGFLCPTHTQARVHYRGFVDLAPGVYFAESYLDGTKSGFGLQFSTTHGIQINKFFIGAGFAIAYFTPYDYYKYYSINGYSWQSHYWNDWEVVPEVFVRGRYDFFSNTRKINPYIQADALLFFPGVALGGGFRYAFNRLVGLNFGLQFDYVYTFDEEPSGFCTPRVTVGIDF